MLNKEFTASHRVIGRFAAWAVFCLEIVYGLVLVLGLLSLQSAQDPIGDPFFSILELLIILIAPLMVISMVAVHADAAPAVKVYSLIALAFMILVSGITSSVHFVILTVSRPIAQAGFPDAFLLFSFRWPSVAYTLDILAWDWFFALSMFFAAPAMGKGRLEKTVRLLMLISGVLSLAGLVGVPLGNMQIRLLGVLGYVGVAPILFLLLGLVFEGTHRQDK
jgi:hypothetical protein